MIIFYVFRITYLVSQKQMKVSISWLKELVKINKPMDTLIHEINMKTIGTKEVTDRLIELDMKGYNRADLLSLRGVAYEVASLLDSEVKFKEDSDYIWQGRDLPSTPVKIEEEELAQIQCVAKIEGLKVEKSSAEWVKKITDSGMRQVNNIADVTNLVMLEYGQPLHAFDAATVENDTINVRRATAGEEIKTLDGKVRVLNTSDIVLADTEKALDVAGVMGGKDTEIKDSTHTILLSGSMFNPLYVRRTATRLKLTSEASKRFYHGLTKQRLLQAFSQAIRMYEELGGKLTAITLKGNFDLEEKEITLRVNKSNSLIGLDFTEEEIKKLLTKLNFKISNEKPRVLSVKRPYWRLDVEIEEDLIEEVARIYGYDRIPSKILPGEMPEKIHQKIFDLIDSLKKQLVHQGISEIQTYSFYSTNVLNALGWDENNKKFLIKLENPMSKETEYMRLNIWPNLTESAVSNNKYFEDVAIFEIGKTYFINEQKQPAEKYVLAISLINNTNNPILELLKILMNTFINLGIGITFGEARLPADAKRLFHPNKFKSLILGGKQIGGGAELHPQIADNFKSKTRIAICEIDLEKLVSG